MRARESQRTSKRERERENARERERVREKASVLPPAHTRHRTAPRPRASLQGGSGVQRGRDRTISQVRPVIACIACMRPHTHTHTHTANNRNDRSAPHAARMQHPHRPSTRCTPAPSTPPPAHARAASTMVQAPHHAARSDSAPPALRPRSSSAHPDAHRLKPCNAGPRHCRAPTPPAPTPRTPQRTPGVRPPGTAQPRAQEHGTPMPCSSCHDHIQST